MSLSRFSTVDVNQREPADGVPNTSVVAVPLSVTGIVGTTFGAYLMVWIVYWVRGGRQPRFRKQRVALVFLCAMLVVVFVYSRLRRYRLDRLRQRAVATATNFVTQSQEFDSAAASTVAAIQDVELAARGYKL